MFGKRYNFKGDPKKRLGRLQPIVNAVNALDARCRHSVTMT
jgi:hypothetical protein